MMNIVRKICFPIAISFMVVSCASKYDNPNDSVAIAFQQIQAETRSVVDGTKLPSGSSFKVWGGMEGSVNNVFNGVVVKDESGKWTYGDDLRFWNFGKPYKFYAVYPSDISNITMEDAGKINISSFDCSKTGTDVVDLMTAASLGIQYNEGETPQPVSLNFNHELARIVFVAKNHPGAQGIDDYNPQVNKAKLYGMYKTGDMSVDYQSVLDRNVVWTPTGNPTDAANPFVEKSETIKVDNDSGITVIEILIFPQNITSEFYFDLEYTASGSGTKTASVQLSSLPVTEWKAGKQYRYSFTITPDDRILFDKPTVDEWDEAMGGIIIVD